MVGQVFAITHVRMQVVWGTTRSSDLREMICALTAEHEWSVRRGPGIDSHIGRRVRDGHLKGPGPNIT